MKVAAERCSATGKASGERCRKYAIRGATVCASHGGAAPQVRRAAAERLRALQDRAVDRIADVLETDDPKLALDASKTVLDRTGLGPSSKTEVEIGAGEQLAQILARLEP